jgi:acyl-CoA synthetase (AMP-forming)/AMP-acid ligase II
MTLLAFSAASVCDVSTPCSSCISLLRIVSKALYFVVFRIFLDLPISRNNSVNNAYVDQSIEFYETSQLQRLDPRLILVRKYNRPQSTIVMDASAQSPATLYNAIYRALSEAVAPCGSGLQGPTGNKIPRRQNVCGDDDPCVILRHYVFAGQRPPLMEPFTSTISYDNVLHAMHEHCEFVSSLVPLRKVNSVHCTPRKGSSTCHDLDDAVLVFYLSANTIDFVLSVVACTGCGYNSGNERSMTTKAGETHHHRNQKSCCRAIPVLLNARWTVQEIAQTILSMSIEEFTSETSSASSQHTSVILMFGAELGEMANSVVRNIQRINQGDPDCILQNGTHYQRVCRCFTIQAVQIPPFAVRRAIVRKANMAPADKRGLGRRQGFFGPANRQTALIVFTSGTTSTANVLAPVGKGVLLSHGAVVIQSWAKCQGPCNYSRDTILDATTVPFFHVGGLTSILAVLLANGKLSFSTATTPVSLPVPSGSASLVRLSSSSYVPESGNPSTTTVTSSPVGNAVAFNPGWVWQSIESAHFATNTLVVVPAMISGLQHELIQRSGSCTNLDPKTRPCSFPSIKLVLVGGQSLSDVQLKFLRDVFPSTKIVQTYACSEAASSLTFLEVNRRHGGPEAGVATIEDRPIGDCVGSPAPHVQIKLVASLSPGMDSQSPDHLVSRPYQVGVIATRGPHTMNGYWHERLQRQNITESTWVLTTDLGFWDDHGQLCFHGRTKDIIRSGGETVMASEVEHIVLQHPLVLDAAVFGAPDNHYGECVCCAIVTESDSTSTASGRNEIPLSLTEIRRWCESRGLAGYKRPRRLYLRHPIQEPLPRNSSGKILKQALVDQYESQEPSNATLTVGRSRM